MAKKLLIICIMFVFPFITEAQNISWEKKYPQTGQYTPVDMEKTSNNDYVIKAHEYSSYHNGFYIKITENGDTVWTKKYNGFGGGYSEAEAVKEVNGNYYVTGEVPFNNKGFYLLKMNSSGDTLWHKLYQFSNSNSPVTIYPFPNGDLLLITVYLNDGFDTQHQIYRLDSLGNILSLRSYPGMNTITKLIRSKNGSYVFCNISNPKRPEIVRINSYGDTILTKKIDIDNSLKVKFIWDIIEDANGDYILTGGIDSLDNTNALIHRNGLIIKCNHNFNVTWYKVYKNPSYTEIHFRSIVQLKDSSYFIGSSVIQGENLLLRYSKNGDIISSKGFIGTIAFDHSFVDMEVNKDSTVVITSYAKDNFTGNRKIYLAKIGKLFSSPMEIDYCKTPPNADFTFTQANDTVYFTNTSDDGLQYGEVNLSEWNFGDGNTSTQHNPKHKYLTNGTKTIKLIVTNNLGCKDTIIQNITVSGIKESVEERWKVIVHPNPSSNIFNFNNTGNNSTQYKLTLLNSLGQQVEIFSFSSKEFSINSNLSSGMYFYLLTDEAGNVRNGKLMVE